MRRIVSLWLPRLPIERLLREKKVSLAPGQPLVLVLPSAKGLRLAACDERALALGLQPGEKLADARAKIPHLASAVAEPEKDAVLLLKLARWVEQWSPWIALDPPDGLFLDVTGIPHLFGGEEAMLARIEEKFARLRLTARSALAGTPSAAWALARFGHGITTPIVPPGGERAALEGLPVQALKLEPETVRTLRRLGLKRIGSLYGIPRASLARRFKSPKGADDVLQKLDEALGLVETPLNPLKPPPDFVVRRSVVEPLVTPEAVTVLIERLADNLSILLEKAGQGALRLILTLYRVDASRALVPAGLGAPSRDPRHFSRLLTPKLEQIDLGFGIEAATLAAVLTAPHDGVQPHFLGAANDKPLTELADRVANRFEIPGLARLAKIESHIPERAEICASENTRQISSSPSLTGAGASEAEKPRPLLLLERPEAVTVIAEVPDGPPRRFTWRKVGRLVVRADGPERIAPEWWRGDALSHMRDYYVVEDEAGRRYWLYRLGLYEDRPPAWFVHGFFS